MSEHNHRSPAKRSELGAYLLLCGPTAKLTSRDAIWKRATIIRLDVTPHRGNVNLRLRDITDRMAAALPAVAEDLAEVATYVYAADQASERGTLGGLDYGRRWRRRFRFEIPVRRPDLWADPRVNDELVRTLSFLSDDDYEFGFASLKAPVRISEYLEFTPGTPDATDVESVVLFSGGLDSLAGAVDEVLVKQRKVVLVSHRPVTKLDGRQRHLAGELARRTTRAREPFTVSVLANKDEELGRDFTQRTRSFLFAAFGAIVVQLFGLDRLKFYENGVVSCNLPICAQVLGGRASRTTHPRVLRNYERLMGLLFDRPLAIENPFFWKTRADVIETLRAAGHAGLAAHTVSCAHTWQATTAQPHCGTCSQCVDRRLGVLAAKLSDLEDPASRYRTDLFVGPLEDVLDQTMVERIVGTARELERIPGPTEFLKRFGEATRLLRQLPGSADEVAVQLFDLHRRHANQVNGVIDAVLAERYRIGDWDRLPPTCLLRVLAGKRELSVNDRGTGRKAPFEPISSDFIPTKEDWAILKALAEAPTTLTQFAIQAAAQPRLDRKTIGKRLNHLVRYALVNYPNGSHKGATLTPAGREWWRTTTQQKAS